MVAVILLVLLHAEEWHTIPSTQNNDKNVVEQLLMFGNALCIFILYHIPTFIYFRIYSKGKKLRLSADIDLMSIQDLE